MKEILFLVVLFVANVIQAITGFAGTVLAMPPSMYLLGMDNAKVVLGAMAWCSGVMIVIGSYRDVQWKELLKMVCFMLVGMAGGITIYKRIQSDDILMLVYGLVILIVAVRGLVLSGRTPETEEDRTSTAAIIFRYLILILAGIIHGMFVSGGALLVIYAVAVLKDKNQFRATVAPIWVVLNTFLMVSQFRQGLYSTSNVSLILIGIPFLILATVIGGKLAKRMNQKVFLILTYLLLFISALSLIL